MRVFFLFLFTALAIGLALSSLYTVDRAEYVYVTQFGRHVATLDGATDGGLHVKLPWPIQSVQRLDRRLQVFDLPETEALTHDPDGRTVDKTLTLVAYVCWRIAGPDNVDQFIRRLGTPERARAVLGERLRSRLGEMVGQMRMDDLISTETRRVEESVAGLRQRLLDEPAAPDYGIELVDIRLRRTGHPLAVREAIFDRIRSERQKKVADYRSEGDRQAEDVKSDAERNARTTLAKARYDEERLKGEANADADRIRNEAQSRDPEFYAFLKKLEEYQRFLGDNKTMLLLSGHSELFDVLFKPPRPTNGNAGREPLRTGGP